MGQRGPCTLACGAGRDSGREKKPTGSRPRKLRPCMMVKVVENKLTCKASRWAKPHNQPSKASLCQTGQRRLSMCCEASVSYSETAPVHDAIPATVLQSTCIRPITSAMAARPQCLKNSPPRLDPPRYFQPKNSSRHAGPRKSSCSLPRFRDLGTCPQREAPSRRQRTSVPEAEIRRQPTHR